MKASLAKQGFFDGLAPYTLQGRSIVKERVHTIANGMSLMALCAMEERIAVAARRVMLTVMLEHHRSLEPGFDYGDGAYLVGMSLSPPTGWSRRTVSWRRPTRRSSPTRPLRRPPMPLRGPLTAFPSSRRPMGRLIGRGLLASSLGPSGHP